MQNYKFLKLLFVLCVLFLSLGQFSSLNKSSGFSLYLFDLAVGIYSIFGLLFILITKVKTHVSKYFLFLSLFSLIAILSFANQTTKYSFEDNLVAGFYFIRWVSYLLAAFVTYIFVINKIFNPRFLLDVFKVSALLISIFGFIQLVILPDFTVLDPILGWDPHKNRLASTFFDPNFTGGYLSLILGMAICFYFWKNYHPSKPDYLIWLTILLALTLTFSRSSWGMLALIVLIVGLLKSRLLLLVSLVLIFSTYFFVPRIQTRITGITDPADSAAFRLVSWKNTLEIASDYPLLGVGFNFFRNIQSEYGFIEIGTFGGNSGGGSDSSILFILATTGIFGLLLFLLAYMLPKGTYLLPLVFGLLLHSQFVNSLFYPPIMFCWLLLFALAEDVQLDFS